MDKVDAKQARRLVLDLIRLGHKPTAQQYVELLPRLRPFLIIQELEGAESTQQSNHLLALLWAAMGDAHIKFGEIEKAALAYSFSTKLHALSSVFDSYAKIVLENSFEQHYAFAITTLVEGVKNDAAHPVWKRMFFQTIWILSQPFSYLDYLKKKKQRKFRLKELQSRLREPAVSCPTTA